MKHRIPIFLFVGMLFLSACEKELMTEEEQEPDTEQTIADQADSKLTIVTRAPSGEVVSYPVTVYILNAEGSCVKKEQLEALDDELSVKLAAGTYQVYAIGGASEKDYVLPEANEASATAEITLRNGAVHGDLMTASNTIKLGRNETNKLVMAFTRKVLRVTEVTISGVPTIASAVSVTLSPLYNGLFLDGTYAADTEQQEETFQLTRQDDGTTWKNTDAINLLPAVSAASVKVSMTLNGKIVSSTYTSSQTVEANHELTITGSYTGEAGEFTMAGVFTGAVWGAPTNISFTFDESGAVDAGSSQGGGGSVVGSEAPAVNTWYKNCFVFMSAEEGNNVVVTLIHRKEIEISAAGKTAEEVESEINAALPSFNINGITGWRLPTAEEAKEVPFGVLMSSSEVTEQEGDLISSSEYYYHHQDNQLKCFVRGGINNVVNVEYEWGTRLRPVTTLRFTKQ